jgi:hypothetical protein
MSKAQLKTVVNDASVDDFLNTIGNDQRRDDAFALVKMMKTVTRKPPRMWGPSIVGFDRFHYKYESGREGEMPIVSFSPRKAALTLYLSRGFPKYDALMKRLGKHSTTDMSCLYIKKLEDVDQKVLRELIAESYAHTKKKYQN